MRQAGFFDTPAEITAGALPEAPSWADSALNYLAGGAVIIAAPAVVEDEVDPGAPPFRGWYLHCDGEWVWPSTLAHYLRRYHVQLPQEFLDHMAARDWVAPEFTEDESAALGERYEREQGWEPEEPPVVRA